MKRLGQNVEPAAVDTSGIEEETLLPEQTRLTIDPAQIRIVSRSFTISEVLDRLSKGLVELSPDFQRKMSVWEPSEKSQLIESVLLRLPLPMFYLQTRETGEWIVIDGLQRISTFKEYVTDGQLAAGTPFALSGLEVLGEHDGKTFSDLPRPAQRLILATALQIHILQPETPKEAVQLIYRRLNSRRFRLSAQDIRHAAYLGASTELLNELVECDAFVQVIGLKERRSVRRYGEELILRFLAFWMARSDIAAAYARCKGLEDFLAAAMVAINSRGPAEVDELRQAFQRGLARNMELFGRHAFRKQYQKNGALNPVNKALFETWMVNLAQLSDAEYGAAMAHRDALFDRSISLIAHAKAGPALDGTPSTLTFEDAISQATNERRRVAYRFAAVSALLRDNMESL